MVKAKHNREVQGSQLLSPSRYHVIVDAIGDVGEGEYLAIVPVCGVPGDKWNGAMLVNRLVEGDVRRSLSPSPAAPFHNDGSVLLRVLLKLGKSRHFARLPDA